MLMTTLLCALLAALGGPREAPIPPQKTTERIVCVGGAITETVFVLGRGEEVVATDSYSVQPTEAQRLPKLGYERALSAEGVLSVSPTLVLLSANAGPPPVVAQLERSGARVICLPEVSDLAGARERVRLLAETLAVEERGAALLESFDARLETLAKREAPARRPRVAYLYASSRSSLHVGGADGPLNELLELAGADNAFAEHRGHVALSPEALVEAQPEIFIVPESSLELVGGRDELLKAPGLRATPAGRAKLVLSVDHQAFTDLGPRTPDTLHELADAIRAWATGQSKADASSR